MYYPVLTTMCRVVYLAKLRGVLKSMIIKVHWYDWKVINLSVMSRFVLIWILQCDVVAQTFAWYFKINWVSSDCFSQREYLGCEFRNMLENTDSSSNSDTRVEHFMFTVICTKKLHVLKLVEIYLFYMNWK